MKFTFPENPHAMTKQTVDGGVVTFPVRRYVPQSPGVNIHAYINQDVVNVVSCDKNGDPLMTNWLVLHKQALPDLILALQYLNAGGPLSREVVKLEMEKQ